MDQVIVCEDCGHEYIEGVNNDLCPHEFIDASTYSNIREILGDFVGKTLLDITQHDMEEYLDGEESFVMMMFDDGSWIKFPIAEEGFTFNRGGDDMEITGEE